MKSELSGREKNSGLRQPCTLTLGTAKDKTLVVITFLGGQRGHSQLEALSLIAQSGLKRLETVG
jgi:hypothetical protein